MYGRANDIYVEVDSSFLIYQNLSQTAQDLGLKGPSGCLFLSAILDYEKVIKCKVKPCLLAIIILFYFFLSINDNKEINPNLFGEDFKV